MAFMIDEAFLPATLTVPPMSDDEFAGFCSEHPDLFFEMTAEGELVVMPPNFSFTGAQNLRFAFKWVSGHAGTNAALRMILPPAMCFPNGARRSPDASWTSRSELRALNIDIRDGYWHLCPAFVIELRSKSDRLRVLREKMFEYIDNGAQLGWLIDPDARTVEVFRQGRDPELLRGMDSVAGEGPVEGFILSLPAVWDPTEA